MEHPAPTTQSLTQSHVSTRDFISDWVSKIEVARRLKVCPRQASDFIKLPYWPAPYELSPRVLRWRWTEIEAALAEHAPRRTERQEPPHLAAARSGKSAA